MRSSDRFCQLVVLLGSLLIAADPGGAADASSPDERAALIRLSELPRSSFALDPEYWKQVETEREGLERLIRSDSGRYLAALDELLWIPADLEQLEQARRGEMPHGVSWFRQVEHLLSLLPNFGDEALVVLRRLYDEAVELAQDADGRVVAMRAALAALDPEGPEYTAALERSLMAVLSRDLSFMLVKHTFRVATKLGTVEFTEVAVEEVLNASGSGLVRGEAALDYLVSLRDKQPEVNARLLLLPMQMPEGRGDYAERQFRERVIAISRESIPR